MENSFAGSGGWRALRDAAVAEKGLPADSPVDGRRVFEWIADGDMAGQRALDRYAHAFDGQLINLQAVLDPEVFVIAGGISCHPELVDALRAQMPLALSSYEGTLAGIPVPQIKAAELGNDANLTYEIQVAVASLPIILRERGATVRGELDIRMYSDPSITNPIISFKPETAGEEGG